MTSEGKVFLVVGETDGGVLTVELTQKPVEVSTWALRNAGIKELRQDSAIFQARVATRIGKTR